IRLHAAVARQRVGGGGHSRTGDGLFVRLANRRRLCPRSETKRRTSGHSAKLISEVGLAAEADLESDLGERLIGPKQQLFRPLDAAERHELMRRHPHRGLEGPCKVRPAQTDLPCEIWECQAGLEIALDLVANDTDRP